MSLRDTQGMGRCYGVVSWHMPEDPFERERVPPGPDPHPFPFV